MNRYLTALALFFLAMISLPVSAADDQPEKLRAEKDRKASPEQIAADFWDRLEDGDVAGAKKLLFTPIKKASMARRIDTFLGDIAKKRKKDGPVHVFGSRIQKDMAIVVYGRESRRYLDGIDIDPIVLRKQDGEWKIVFANSADDLKKHELTDDVLRKRADELLEWYKKREEEVRAERRKKHTDEESS